MKSGSADCGFAARVSGKAWPFRKVLFLFPRLCLRSGGIASKEFEQVAGKAKRSGTRACQCCGRPATVRSPSGHSPKNCAFLSPPSGRHSCSPTCERGVSRHHFIECVKHTAYAACFARSGFYRERYHTFRLRLHMWLQIYRPLRRLDRELVATPYTPKYRRGSWN